MQKPTLYYDLICNSLLTYARSHKRCFHNLKSRDCAIIRPCRKLALWRKNKELFHSPPLKNLRIPTQNKSTCSSEVVQNGILVLTPILKRLETINYKMEITPNFGYVLITVLSIIFRVYSQYLLFDLQLQTSVVHKFICCYRRISI